MPFAEKHLQNGPSFARKILFTDEKKFCLFDSRHGKWILTRGDESYNVARYFNMNDEEYREWTCEHRTGQLPRTEQRGLYPWFVWGAVGYNMKSDLYFLDQGQTLTAELYIHVLRQTLLPVRKQYPKAWYSHNPRMHITMDNDPKHYNDVSRQLLDKQNIQLVGCHRHDVHGKPDVAPGPGGSLQEQIYEDKFPAYRCVFCLFSWIFIAKEARTCATHCLQFRFQ